MPVDKTLIKRKIALISEDLKQLKKLSRLSLQEFLEKYENEILAERYMERIIGRMIDINYHIITETGHMPPKDYYNSFIELGKLKVINFALAKKLAQSAGLRNRIAHEYDSIDEKQIYKAIKACFTDLPNYLLGVNKYIS